MGSSGQDSFISHTLVSAHIIFEILKKPACLLHTQLCR